MKGKDFDNFLNSFGIKHEFIEWECPLCIKDREASKPPPALFVTIPIQHLREEMQPSKYARAQELERFIYLLTERPDLLEKLREILRPKPADAKDYGDY